VSDEKYVPNVDVMMVYEAIDNIVSLNNAIRKQAFDENRQDLWQLFEVGHNTQLALAAYVVALQSHGDI